MNRKRLLALALVCVVLAAAAAVWLFSGPFAAGNRAEYDVKTITPQQTALTGKTLYWLGSSVTLGMTSCGQAVPDYIAAHNGAVCVKEAVSGTTLIDKPFQQWFQCYDSYITRLKNSTAFDPNAAVDAFICQISTNDVKKANIAQMGAVTAADVTDMAAFDLQTTLGAMEYIIAYVEKTWNCPVVFYSGAYFGGSGRTACKDPSGSDYAALVQKTFALADKWNGIDGYEVHVIDLFNDRSFNSISDADYRLYMNDPLHPRKAGYLEWWTPAVEAALTAIFP